MYAAHAATKGAAPTRGLRGEIGSHDGSATSLSVDSTSSMTVLQGEHSEKNSTGIKYTEQRIMHMAIRNCSPLASTRCIGCKKWTTG